MWSEKLSTFPLYGMDRISYIGDNPWTMIKKTLMARFELAISAYTKYEETGQLFQLQL